MITLSFYFDCRRVKAGHPAPVRVVINRNQVRAFVGTGVSVLPSQWDAVRKVVLGHPGRVRLNMVLAERKLQVDEALRRIEASGRVTERTTAADL